MFDIIPDTILHKIKDSICHLHHILLDKFHHHPAYNDRQDLIHRMGTSNGDFELIPHSISHTTSSGVKKSTKALEIRLNHHAHKEVCNNLLKCLAKGPSDTRLVMNPNTENFKLIPFANNTFSTDQTTALIQT